MCECIRVVDLPPLSFRTPKVPGVPQCKSDIPKYCNMLTKNVVSVVGQKCEPFFLVVDGSSLNASLDKKIDSLELSLRPQKIWVWNSVAGHKCESIFLVVNLPSLRLGASKSRLPFPRPKFPKKCGPSSVLWCVTKLLCCQSPPLPPHVRYKKCEYIFKLFLCDAAACWIFKTPMLVIPNP